MGKGPMDRLPKLGFVAAHINVAHNGLGGRKNIVSMRPETCRHDDFFSHENPWQEWVKRHLPQKVGVRDKVPGGGKGSKTRNVQFLLVVFLKERSRDVRF
jgi:hypothetical protein